MIPVTEHETVASDVVASTPNQRRDLAASSRGDCLERELTVVARGYDDVATRRQVAVSAVSAPNVGQMIMAVVHRVNNYIPRHRHHREATASRAESSSIVPYSRELDAWTVRRRSPRPLPIDLHLHRREPSSREHSSADRIVALTVMPARSHCSRAGQWTA